MMNNLFLILNILGIGLYLSLIPLHVALYEHDKKEGKTGFFKRGRFTSGILLIYLVFLSKSFGWDGFFGFAQYGIFIQTIWLIWHSRTLGLAWVISLGINTNLRRIACNIIGISTYIYEVILYFRN